MTLLLTSYDVMDGTNVVYCGSELLLPPPPSIPCGTRVFVVGASTCAFEAIGGATSSTAVSPIDIIFGIL
eukprot:CAMPEP_0201699988 /NCGR_PEP_ID=MMETSP0578-20130828/26376_1 /ASSEMBLY_ACC=CAM_ASM_000663 /TAXON_ID=267565 /ORGANISM="Skeletonema grethea, Strain CCMP 1804" /LENGTH=69 /DNA_ID=CAMNT_0048186901 /DNA_START=92 /DNA_END=297 /DNA_ORIENTATION=-